MKWLLPLVLLATACSHSRAIAPQQLALIPNSHIQEDKKQPFFAFAWQDRSFRIASGKWKIPELHPGRNQAFGWGPVVWVSRQGKETQALDLREAFPSHYVAHVFQDQTLGRLFLFLDYGIEGPARNYIVWISEDRGEHWFRGEDLRRPPESFPPAILDNFVLNEKGEGMVWFRLEAAHLPAEKRVSLPAANVFYLTRTHNGGRSWVNDSRPAFTNLLEQEEERHH